MATDFFVRRAVADDFDAVVNIIDDLWSGNDYLPTMYHILLQSKQYVLYVAEMLDSGRVISFLAAHMLLDGSTVLLMARRTHKDFQGKGVNKRLEFELRTDFPAITNIISAGEISAQSQSVWSGTKRLYTWNCLVYELSVSTTLEFKSSALTSMKRLSLSECIDLVSSGACKEFLAQFAVDYIVKADPSWDVVPLAEDLSHVMRTASSVLATYAEEHGGQICGISFAELMLLKTKLKTGVVEMQVQFFGSSLNDLLDHVRSHLQYSVDVTCGCNVDVVINFPTCIDMELASRHVSSTDIFSNLKRVEASTNYLVLSSIGDK